MAKTVFLQRGHSTKNALCTMTNFSGSIYSGKKSQPLSTKKTKWNYQEKKGSLGCQTKNDGKKLRDVASFHFNGGSRRRSPLAALSRFSATFDNSPALFLHKCNPFLLFGGKKVASGLVKLSQNGLPTFCET